MKKSFDVDAKTVTFAFEGLEPVVLHRNRLSDCIAQQFMLHGMLARLGDAAAIPRKQPDGSIINVTEAMRRDAVKVLVEHYETGTEQWNLKGNGARVAKLNPTLIALAEKTGRSYAEVEAHYAAMLLKELEEIGGVE